MSRRFPPSRRPPVEEDDDSDEEDFEEDEEEEEEIDPTEKINGLPVEQRRRVYALKALVKSTRAAQMKKKERIAALEKEFAEKYAPLFELRRKIIAGEHEPTAEEIAKGDDPKKGEESKVEEIPSDDEDTKKPGAKPAAKKATVVAPGDKDEKNLLEDAASRPDGGIPHFWLTAMKNSEMMEGMIMPRDEEALKALTDIRSTFVEGDPRKGFVLEFHFAENAFFSNQVLTKTYLFDPEDNDDYALDDVKGCEIDWTSKQNKLTVVMKEKKQRHKSGKGVRVVTKEEKVPSFFHFFDPPKVPKSDDEIENDDELDELDAAQEELQMDFESGQAFFEMLVPRAVYYYTGESIADIAQGMLAQGMHMGDDDDEEDEEEEDDEPTPAPKGGRGRGGYSAGGRGGRGGAGNEKECKQQ